MLGGLLLVDMEVDSVTGGHGEVRDEGNGRNECSQDMEQAFLLRWVRSQETAAASGILNYTHNWDSHGHGIEGKRRQSHEDSNDPA